MNQKLSTGSALQQRHIPPYKVKGIYIIDIEQKKKEIISRTSLQEHNAVKDS